MHARDWTGRETRLTDSMDPWAANALVATLDLDRPVFGAGDPLPPFWHWLYFREAAPRSALGPDGHPAPGVSMPPVAQPRRMWAGGRLRFGAPLPLAAAAERRSTIAEVAEKTGRRGAMTFVTVVNEIEGPGGLAVREEQDIVYRDDPDPAAPAPEREPAPRDEDRARTWTCDSTVLFRYSALTFNGHRIHYDADYARDVEGYPGLVVHGPLLATLLLELVDEVAGPPVSFAFRATAPVFADEPFDVCARDGGRTLWVRGADGRLAMRAEAGW